MNHRKTRFIVAVVGGLLGSVWATTATAQPISVTAHVTADNHYALYVGNAEGTDLVFVGRNEKTYSGNPGTYNWSTAEQWSFDMSADEYIYVVAWNDGGGARMFIADFQAPGAVLISNSPQWKSLMIPQPPPGESGDVILTDVLGAIATGQWMTPAFELANDATPNIWNGYGGVSGVLPSANFIWHDQAAEYVVFRAAAPVPPPPTCDEQLAAAAQAIEDLTEELAVAQAQIADLTGDLAQAQQQLDSLNGSLAALVATIEADFRRSFKDPVFVLPGADPLEKLQNLVIVITGLQRGSKLQVYTGLGGHPGIK